MSAGNPMNLNGPWMPPFHQPGTPITSGRGTDIGGDVMECMIDQLPGRRVGSCSFSFRCPRGHQWDYSAASGQVVYLASTVPTGDSQVLVTNASGQTFAVPVPMQNIGPTTGVRNDSTV